MSKTNFTSGRWVAGFGHQHAFRVYQDSLDGDIIGHFNCSGGVKTGLEAQANTVLCAHAPQLYAQVEEFVDCMFLWEGEGNLPKEWEAILSNAVELLERARGEKS